MNADDSSGNYLEQVVGLASHAYDLPLTALSKGEQFRVELARGLVSGSVVDEFTSNTDRQVFRVSAAQ
jgi:ABC-type ATPase involved in cell division